MPQPYCSEFFKAGIEVGLFVALIIFFIVVFFGEEIAKWIRKVLR